MSWIEARNVVQVKLSLGTLQELGTSVKMRAHATENDLHIEKKSVTFFTFD